jgi:hypothetical protein
MAPPAVRVADGGAPRADIPGPDAEAPDATPMTTASGERDAGVDAAGPQAPPPGPSFSAGAGRFLTEPPPGGASSFVSNPDAGAGTFLTTPTDPYSGSSYKPPANAGAGAFTTERNEDFSFPIMTPQLVFVPIAPPSATRR